MEPTRDSPMSIDPIETLDTRHADQLQPNAPSCGNQPANISLTARRNDTPCHPTPGEQRAPPSTQPGGALPCPLDNRHVHIRRTCTSPGLPGC